VTPSSADRCFPRDEEHKVVQNGEAMKPANTVVLIPTHNERDNVKSLVRGVLDRQREVDDFAISILVVDSRSADGTQGAVQDLIEDDRRVRLLEVSERGLGLALMEGYRWASEEMGAQVIVQMDGDHSHDPRYLPEMLREIAQGYDLVVGSRYIEGGRATNWPLSRRILSWGANLLIRLMTGRWNIHEWTSGYRAFTTDLYRKLDFESIGWRDYTLVPAFVYEAVCKGARVKEVPIVFVNRKLGESKLPMSYGVNLVRHFATASFRYRLGRHKSAPQG